MSSSQPPLFASFSCHVTPEKPWHERFQAARKRAGLTSAAALGEKVGASERTAIRWETGESQPATRFRLLIGSFSAELLALVDELPTAPPPRRSIEVQADRLSEAIEQLVRVLVLLEKHLA
jgi:DNA-binding XRE family transcriptional regulator